MSGNIHRIAALDAQQTPGYASQQGEVMYHALLQRLHHDTPDSLRLLDNIDPRLLMEAAEELTAGAKCLQQLRRKETELESSDRMVLDYVIGSIRRSASRTLTHLEQANLAEMYERYQRLIDEAAAEEAEALIADHMSVEIFDGTLSQREQDYLANDIRERRGNWLWERRRSGSERLSPFGRVRAFIDGIRNHWLLRPAGLGIAFIAYDIAIATSTFYDGELRPDKFIVVAKELPSIPMGLAMIASPFLPKGRWQEK